MLTQSFEYFNYLKNVEFITSTAPQPYSQYLIKDTQSVQLSFFNISNFERFSYEMSSIFVVFNSLPPDHLGMVQTKDQKTVVEGQKYHIFEIYDLVFIPSQHFVPPVLNFSIISYYFGDDSGTFDDLQYVLLFFKTLSNPVPVKNLKISVRAHQYVTVNLLDDTHFDPRNHQSITITDYIPSELSFFQTVNGRDPGSKIRTVNSRVIDGRGRIVIYSDFPGNFTIGYRIRVEKEDFYRNLILNIDENILEKETKLKYSWFLVIMIITLTITIGVTLMIQKKTKRRKNSRIPISKKTKRHTVEQ
ncbi:hypothetical protein GEMRC1_003769 [Eukaryota sp. GEM-RC1]